MVTDRDGASERGANDVVPLHIPPNEHAGRGPRSVEEHLDSIVEAMVKVIAEKVDA